ILGTVFPHEPDGSLLERGINLLRHDAILPTRKDAASNLRRFISRDTDRGELGKAVAVVDDRGDVALSTVGEAGLFRDPEVEVSELLPCTR
ncbi:MAG: hypothetical protein QM607_12380, partial [Microbacterium sp.]